MHNLKPITALGGTEPRIDRIGGLTVTEVPAIAIASVATRLGGEKATAAALKKLIGAPLPGPGKTAGKAPMLAIWSGPDQWMVIAPLPEHELLADTIADAVKGKASVTEQSGAWVQFDVEGAAVLDFFERLSALPIRKMQAGDGERTRIEHLNAMVICHGARFSILGAGSSAGSLHHALVTAARSVA